jgi:hypothetical protein
MDIIFYYQRVKNILYIIVYLFIIITLHNNTEAW